MRVGFDGTPLMGQRAGIGNYTTHLLSALLANDCDNSYLLYSNRPLGVLEPQLRRAIQVEGYLPRSRWLWMQFVLPQVIHQSQPDLCHFTNASAPLRQSKPFVLTIHDASLFLYHQYHPWSRLLAIRVMLPILARQAAAVITVSQYARADLVRVLKLPADKIHVIYEAPPIAFQPVNEAYRREVLQRKYNLPEKYIFYLGTLEPRKNLKRLVRAFKQLRQRGCQVQLVMAGPAGWRMKGFAQEIARLGLENAVHYLGYVPTEDLPGLYSMATLFAFPSLYEGFGLPPLEAMACGTPVLTSRNSAMAEVCDQAAHLVDPMDEDDLANGMWQMLSDAEWRTELQQRGLLRAKQFSWERAARETVSVYEQVLQVDRV